MDTVLFRIGSSIVVATKLPSSVYSKLVNNPQCFLLYGGTPVKSFTDITDVRQLNHYLTTWLPLPFVSQLNFTFKDNTASEATAIYLSNAQVCSWIGNSPPYFNTTSILTWPFLHRRLRPSMLLLSDYKICNMCMSYVPDMCVQSPRTTGPAYTQLYIKQIMSACVTTNVRFLFYSKLKAVQSRNL